jgi:hypothetical protein
MLRESCLVPLLEPITQSSLYHTFGLRQMPYAALILHHETTPIPLVHHVNPWHQTFPHVYQSPPTP